jgi:hypothetical protein
MQLIDRRPLDEAVIRGLLFAIAIVVIDGVWAARRFFVKPS